jgi:acetyl-CoA carboxylase carboxyl transferase subunit beta
VKNQQEELITRSKKTNFVMISKSGGARMMEAAYLNAISQNICKLAQLAEAKLPYISLCTDQQQEEPQLLCYVRDINISEPGALIDLHQEL